jgi:hypothetical protein
VSEGRVGFAPKLFSCGLFEKAQTGLTPVKRACNPGSVFLFWPPLARPSLVPVPVTSHHSRILACSISCLSFSSGQSKLAPGKRGKHLREPEGKKLRQRALCRLYLSITATPRPSQRTTDVPRGGASNGVPLASVHPFLAPGKWGERSSNLGLHCAATHSPRVGRAGLPSAALCRGPMGHPLVCVSSLPVASSVRCRMGGLSLFLWPILQPIPIVQQTGRSCWLRAMQASGTHRRTRACGVCPVVAILPFCLLAWLRLLALPNRHAESKDAF